MLKTVTMRFNETNPMFDTTSNEYNRLLLENIATHLKDILKGKGYIYLNDIYEAYYVKWNTEWENVCIIGKDHTVTMDIKIRARKCGDFVITVTW